MADIPDKDRVSRQSEILSSDANCPNDMCDIS